MRKLVLLIFFLLNLLLLQAQEVKFISVNSSVDTFDNVNFKRLPKLLAKDSITADTLEEPTKWMEKLSKKLSCKQQKDSNIYIFFVPEGKDSARVFLPLSGKYGYVIFDSTKTGVYWPDSLIKRLHMQKYQWDAIHDPQTMLFSWAQDEEEGAYTWDFFGEKYTKLFNHIYDNNNEDKLSYLGKIKGTGSVETLKLEYTDGESKKWSKDEKAYIDSWEIGTYDGDKIAKSVFDKIKQAKKDSEIDDINLGANRIYIGNFSIGDQKYPVATYAPKGAVTDIKKITVTDSDVLEKTDAINYVYCDETYTKYLIIAFYKDGAEKTDPSLIMQIEKFVGDDTKDKWLEYLGILLEENNESKKGNKEIIVEIERIRNNDHRTVGKINIDNGAITGYTLELPKGSDSECKSACTDSKKIDNECKRIVQGTYTFGITTWSDKADFINKSLRLNNVPGRTGILMHRGVNARIWSYGCILAMRNDPTNDKDDAGPSERANKIDDSEAFCIEIIDYIKKRSNEIKKEYSIDEVVMKIIITEKQ